MPGELPDWVTGAPRALVWFFGTFEEYRNAAAISDVGMGR